MVGDKTITTCEIKPEGGKPMDPAGFAKTLKRVVRALAVEYGCDYVAGRYIITFRPKLEQFYQSPCMPQQKAGEQI